MLRRPFVAKRSRTRRRDRRRRPRARALTRIQTWSNASLRGPSRRARAHLAAEVKATSEAPVWLFVALPLQLTLGPRGPGSLILLSASPQSQPPFPLLSRPSLLSAGGESGEVRRHSHFPSIRSSPFSVCYLM